jgi:hypothetical protein
MTMHPLHAMCNTHSELGPRAQQLCCWRWRRRRPGQGTCVRDCEPVTFEWSQRERDRERNQRERERALLGMSVRCLLMPLLVVDKRRTRLVKGSGDRKGFVYLEKHTAERTYPVARPSDLAHMRYMGRCLLTHARPRMRAQDRRLGRFQKHLEHV